MEREKRREWYLNKAREADENSDDAIDAWLKEHWKSIAEGFRHLAKTT
jgi:hypothetical protein